MHRRAVSRNAPVGEHDVRFVNRPRMTVPQQRFDGVAYVTRPRHAAQSNASGLRYRIDGMHGLVPGIRWWQAPHPEWKPESSWPELVTCYALERDDGVVLVDPLAAPDELTAKATAVVITCKWHVRDAEKLGVPVARPGEELPDGLEWREGMESYDQLVWVPEHGALISGDTFVERGRGLEVPSEWVDSGESREAIIARLRSLLDLPIEHVLPTHGEPTDRSALERVLG